MTSAAAAARAQQQQQKQAAAEAAVKQALTKFDQGLTSWRLSVNQAVAAVQQGLAQAGLGINKVLTDAAVRVQNAGKLPTTFFASNSVSAGDQAAAVQNQQWLGRLRF